MGGVLAQLSSASSSVGFEVYDGYGFLAFDSAGEPKAWARFEVTGLDWALDQLRCAVPDRMATLGTVKASLVRVEVHDAAGSGVVVRADEGSSIVITAWHVVESYCLFDGECVGVSVVQNGKRSHATLINLAPEEDLAVLRVDAEFPAIPIGGIPSLETAVTTVGMPAGEHDFQYNEGIVVGYDGCSFPSCVRTNARAWSGFSGGALVNEQGELVGVISEGWLGSTYSNAVSTQGIRRILLN